MAWNYSETHRSAAVAIIQRVMDGTLTLDNVRQLNSAADRAYAAVGWMLRNAGDYLDDNGFVLSKYEDTLKKIAGQSSGGSPYSYYTMKAGLHVSHSCKESNVPEVMIEVGDNPRSKVRKHQTRLTRVIRLLPLEPVPNEITLEPGEKLLAAALAHQVLDHGEQIAHEVFALLQAKLSN